MATRDDIFKWVIRNNKRPPMTSGDYINMPAARAFYIDEASRENIGDGNSSEALSERATNQNRGDDGKFAAGGGKHRNKQPEDITELLGEEFKGVKGQQAVDKLMQEKRGHVKGAFHREDIGDIDLIWGDDTCGLQHILSRREEQGINAREFVQDLAEVVEKGQYRRRNDRGNFEFLHGRKMAVISPELRGNKLTFLVTAFKTTIKK